MKRIVLLNEQAGQKGGLPTNRSGEDDVRAALERHAVQADLLVTQSEDDCRAAARRAVAQGYDVVVAAGGDGTVGTVATELLESRTALGILPLGSVMNIARMLEIPRDVDAAAEALRDGEVRTVDVGTANGHVFYEAASVGISAAVFREAQRLDEGDRWAPLRSMWVALRYRPGRMMIELDGESLNTRALMVAVCVGPYMGMGLTVAPQARLDDGFLDVVLFERFSKLELLRHLASIAFGRRRYTPHTRSYRSQSVRIVGRHELPCRADSRDLGSTPLECRVRPASLRVLVAAGQSSRALTQRE
jgi:diacylglycerol kinase (ATP)